MVRGEPDVMMTCRISASLARDMEQYRTAAEIADTRELVATMFSLYRWAEGRSRDGKAIVALDERTMKYNELELAPLVTLKANALAQRALRDAGMTGEV